MNFSLDAQMTLFIVGTLLPLLVGLVTKLSSPAWVKAWLHAVVSLAAGLIIVATQVDGTAVFSRETVIAGFLTWVTGMAAYRGFLVPTRISPVINNATAGGGI